MVITYHKGQCVKISFGDLTLVFNPISKESSLPTIKFGADIALISLNHPDFNGAEQAALGAKQPFVIKGPGEYELGSVTVRGFGVSTKYEGKDCFNTIYQVRLEDMNILFLGALGSPEIDPKILGEFGDIDILFVPIGGGEVLDVPQASKLAVKLESKLTIPIHYDQNALKVFLKEVSAEGVKTQEKLTLKKRDVSLMEAEVMVVSS